ncbi:MAG: YidC/Oxa1 family membrane protein insertase [Candidatus Andersenbacteria bacterium]
MNPFSFLYTEVLYRPLLNLLVGITNVLPGHSIGFAIIAVTFLVRLVLLPSSLHHARQMRANQGKMDGVKKDLVKIKEKHKDDKAKQAEETMRLYREAGINPASGCLPLLIQLPILIALYRVFLTGLSPDTFHFLYGFVSEPTVIQTMFFGLALDEPSLLLGVVAAVAQFTQMKWLSPTPPVGAQPGANEDAAAMMASMQKNMMYIFPVMTIFISLQLPGALALYWATSTIFGMVQQYILKRTLHLEGNPPAV